MAKKKFKTESQKLLDMMINSIYTHKEIFLRELISNASDAIDKLYFRSLTDSSVVLGRTDYEIRLDADMDARTLTISDNGCGMTESELEDNLGTIAKSGSLAFKRENGQCDDIDVIGQFGVGFYSAFMVAEKITVTSRVYGADKAYKWESEGVDGYTVTECEKKNFGTSIVLHIKPDTEDEKFSEFLEEYRLRSLVKKHSDYIRYPINMTVSRKKPKDGVEGEFETVSETETLNSMTPIWKKSRGEVSDEEYSSFYKEKFYDYEDPLRTVTQKSEGTVTYNALLFIPSHAPFNYYTKEYEKGLELYSSGVMIMERCSDLLPDYFGFVKGLVDSSDLSLNVSREMLQHDRQLKVMAKAIEKKIKSELESLLKSDREKYEKFFDAFGIQLKYGVYSDYGMHKDTLVDLLLFRSSKEKKHVTLAEYCDGMKADQKAIYYATGESADKIDMLPKVEALKSRGFEVLYLTDDVDEFAIKILGKYRDIDFKNAAGEELDISTEEERASIEKKNADSSALLDFLKKSLGGEVSAVRFTNSLGGHPVSLSSEGEYSYDMEKVLKKMPGGAADAPTASLILEINASHPISDKLLALFEEKDEGRVEKYAKILYSQARLISGLSVENPTEIASLIVEFM